MFLFKDNNNFNRKKNFTCNESFVLKEEKQKNGDLTVIWLHMYFNT